jgi:hypothetical protein
MGYPFPLMKYRQTPGREKKQMGYPEQQKRKAAWSKIFEKKFEII